MALKNVIRYAADPVTGSGMAVYCVIFRGTNEGATSVYNTGTGTFVSCNEVNWANYAITLTEGCANTYATPLPQPLQLPAKSYDVLVYQRAGATPSPTLDTLLGAGSHDTGNLNLSVLPSVPAVCIQPGASACFLLSCTSEDGPLAPGAVIVGVTGTGSAVEAALPGHTSLRKITYTAAAGGAGTEDVIVATVTFNFPDDINQYGTITHKIAVPVHICDSATYPTEATIAAEVDAVLQGSHGVGTWVSPTAAVVAAETNTVLTASHGAGNWVPPTQAVIAAQVDSTLSAAHGAGAWGGAGVTEQIIAAEVDAVLSASHGAGGWTTGAGGTGIEISS